MEGTINGIRQGSHIMYVGMWIDGWKQASRRDPNIWEWKNYRATIQAQDCLGGVVINIEEISK